MRIEALFLIVNVALSRSSGLSRPRNGAHLFLPHPTSLHAQIQILSFAPFFRTRTPSFLFLTCSLLFSRQLSSLAPPSPSLPRASPSPKYPPPPPSATPRFPSPRSTASRSAGAVTPPPGYPNQEDHRIRAISHTSLWLASSGLEFAHTSKEAVELLPIVPDCPNNCSSIASCVERVCACPEGYMGEDCSIARVQCPFNCYGHGLCIGGLCSCHAGYTGGSCQFTAQLCPFNCSGHGLCSEAGVCACEPGFTGADCSMATPDCLNNCTGHGTCANSGCTSPPPPRPRFGYSAMTARSSSAVAPTATARRAASAFATVSASARRATVQQTAARSRPSLYASRTAAATARASLANADAMRALADLDAIPCSARVRAQLQRPRPVRGAALGGGQFHLRMRV